MTTTMPARLRPKAETAVSLATLLNRIYPDPNPDVFTLDSFKNSFKLTGLGESAIRTIEKSQRISQSIGDYSQRGLCAFHIGLIYLHSDDNRAAAQFGEAARQWRFADHAAAIAIAYFAEAQALEYSYHLEQALNRYQKTAQWLARAAITDDASSTPFLPDLTDWLEQARTALRQQLWAVPLEESRLPKGSHDTQPELTPTPSPTQSPTPTPASTAATAVPPPSSHLTPPTETAVIPGHTRTDPRYHWYQLVTNSSPPLIPNLPEGAWLLVQHNPTIVQFQQATHLLIAIDTQLNNGMLVKSYAANQPKHHLYLCQTIKPAGSTTQNETTRQVILAPNTEPANISLTQIIGVVIGIWLQTGEATSNKG